MMNHLNLSVMQGGGPISTLAEQPNYKVNPTSNKVH